MAKSRRYWVSSCIAGLAFSLMVTTVALAKGHDPSSEHTKSSTTVTKTHKAATQHSPIITAEQESIGQIGEEAANRAKTLFPDLYGGFALTNNMSHVNIYLTKLSPTIKQKIQGTIPAGEITFHKVAHTEKQLLAIHEKVNQASDKLRAGGIQIIQFGPDVKTGKEQIKVENVTASEKQSLYHQFGKDNIEVSNMKPSDAPVIYVAKYRGQ